MGGICHELLLPLDVPRHLVEQAVDRHGQPVEFVLRAQHLEPVSEPRGLELLCGPQDLGHRLGGTDRQPVADQRREEREPGGHRQQQPCERVDVVVEEGGRHADPHVERLVRRIRDPPTGEPVAPDLDEILDLLPRHRPGGHLRRAAFALPERPPVVGEQLGEPAAFLVASRLAPQFVHDGVGVRIEVLERDGDLVHLAAEHHVGLAIESCAGAHFHGEQRHEHDQQHDERVPDREPDAERGPRDPAKQS